MRRGWLLVLTLVLTLTACQSGQSGGSTPTGTAGLVPAARCGDNRCDSGETALACPQDCTTAAFGGKVRTTYIKSGEAGNIAVMVASPKLPRFSDGAGIVVVAPPIFPPPDGFMQDPDVTALGLIQVSFLWPGKKDTKTGVQSEGQFDYGGAQSTQIVTDVLRYAAGRAPDIDGRYIYTLSSVQPLTDQVGVYALSDASIPVVNAFTLNGNQLVDLSYFIGNENPTVDTLADLETGYFDDNGQPVYNPLYAYPAGYSPTAIGISYANLRWDAGYIDSKTHAVGRPYLDLDGNGQVSGGDFIFSSQVPVMFGLRYYSAGLTKALLDNNALSLFNWPADLATPDEAAQAWQYRDSVDRYKNFTLLTNDWKLRVMLVFAAEDHLQAARDKPHIHQAFQGFRFQGGLWVRLNPDRAYVQDILQKFSGPAGYAGTPAETATPSPALDFPDTPANTQPGNWLTLDSFAYPLTVNSRRLVPLAAVSEMADRSHDGIWKDNLGQVLYSLPALTPTP
jgi:hypothetical protein